MTFPEEPAPLRPKMATLVLMTALSVLSLNMFLPSLKQMAVDFEVDYALASVALGGYLAVTSVLQLIMGPLSDKLGRRPVALAGLAIFVIASVGCIFAEDIWLFLGFRMLQGAVIGGMVISRAVVRDIAPPQEAARLLAVMGTAMALAPLMGPVLGGFLDVWFGWRANFVAFTLMGAAMLALTWADLKETNLTPSASFMAQFRSYPELVRSGLFWAYCACLVFSVGGFYAFLGGAPAVAEQVFGLSPAQVGLGMGSISGGFMLGNIVSSRMAGRWSIGRLMILGRWVALLGPLAALALIALGFVNPFVMFGGAIGVGLGNGLTLPGANAGVMSVAPRLAGSASGLSGALTVAGGAVLTSVVGAAVAGSWGIYALLGAMAATSLIGLLASYLVVSLEARRVPD